MRSDYLDDLRMALGSVDRVLEQLEAAGEAEELNELYAARDALSVAIDHFEPEEGA